MTNRPVNFSDPTGHKEECEEKNCDEEPTLEEQLASMKKTIKDKYKWNIKGDNWTLDELRAVYQIGRDIEGYVDKSTGGKGLEWMNSYLSDTNLRISSRDRGMGLPGSISLPKWWNGSTNFDKYYLAHELAHIWDISSGNIANSTKRGINNTPHLGPFGAVNGPGDLLNTYIGGNVVSTNGCRNCDLSGANYIPNSYLFTRGGNPPYGNNSTADYLADSFAYSIYSNEYPGYVPNSNVTMWIDTFISVQASNIP